MKDLALNIKRNSNPVLLIMKKLLTILLLFFPFHGAWAETLNLKCTGGLHGENITILKFDTIKKTLINEAGKVHKIEINDAAISWITFIQVSKHSEPEVRKFSGIEEKGDLMNVLENILNRDSGKIMIDYYVTTVKNAEENHSMGPKAFIETLKVIYRTTYECEKHSGKNKF